VRFQTLEFTGDTLRLIDQTKLPRTLQYIDCQTVSDVYVAIRDLVVRGAPAIGVAAAYAMVIAARRSNSKNAEELLAALRKSGKYLKSCRPTAVNLAWAIDRMQEKAEDCRQADPAAMIKRLEEEARMIEAEDRAMCRKIGENGEPLIPDKAGVLTHCNAGALATAGMGTALAVLYVAHERGKNLHVYADETRPLWQGARLTAWELQQSGIDVTLICDNVAGSLFRAKRIDAVIVGADRITKNGDVANKIGTYSVAVQAEKHGVPFYVAAPQSTIDQNLLSGKEIPIEERPIHEVTKPYGLSIAPEGIKVYAPAFDVTPNEMVTAIVTDQGIWHGGRWNR
jgi:methylthioribose-1-phosphate isomerase